MIFLLLFATRTRTLRRLLDFFPQQGGFRGEGEAAKKLENNCFSMMDGV